MSQPRIALDVSFAKLVGIGVGVYASNIWAALTPLLGDRLVPVCSKFARPPRGARRTFRERLDTLMRDLWWHQAGVTVAARRCGAQLLHLPAGVGPVAGRFPAVTTIHDVMPIRFAPMAPNVTAAVPRKRSDVIPKPTNTEIGIVRFGLLTSDAITAIR